MGRLLTVIDPLIETPADKVVSYTWDEAGNPLTRTDRLGHVTRTTYDALNRPSLTEYLTDATTESIIYDIYGNRYSVANGAVTYSYTYDLKNRMLSKTDNRLNKTITYTYDKAGNIRPRLYVYQLRYCFWCYGYFWHSQRNRLPTDLDRGNRQHRHWGYYRHNHHRPCPVDFGQYHR